MKTQLRNWPNLKEAGKRTKTVLERVSGDIIPSDFLLSWGQGKKFLIKTYGCQANVRDSEVLFAYLSRMGMTPTEDPSEASIILINTCAIREHAESRIRGELGHLKPLFLANNDLIIGLCGCISQEEESLGKLKESYPFLNLAFGTANIYKLYELLEIRIKNKVRVFDVPSSLNKMIESYPEHRFDKVKAFVNIMYGCDKFCTYCIVPFTRGRQRSRDLNNIVEEVRELISRGYKEVTLLGQNVNAYGKDLESEVDFAKLLEEVAKTGIDRIRFMSSHPADFEDNVFEVMGKYKNIMPSLHLPLQSGSTSVLKKMNRSYDRAGYLELVASLREHVPDIRLTTDIIVCFPTETEEDLLETVSIIKEVHFAAAYNFIYSRREGTPAAKLENPFTPLETKRRFALVQKTIDDEATQIAKREVGTIVKVLFDDFDETNQKLRGYDQYGKLIHVEGPSVLVGTISDVKLIESHTYSFIGELV